MKKNIIKEVLQQGGVSIGTMVFEFDSTGIARIAAETGAEFVIFDMEHTGWGEETIRKLMATTPKSRITPMVRIPDTKYHFTARVLDMGAMGIMVPRVETEEQAKHIVQCSKYPPLGRRGAAFGIAHDDYQTGDVVAAMVSANREQLLIAQIETQQGVQNVGEIAAVEGIDVLWIGHFDLSISLGIPGQFDHPQFQEAVEQVLEACRPTHKTAGFLASDIANGRQLLSQGFRILAYGGDLWLYQQALQEGISTLKKINANKQGD